MCAQYVPPRLSPRRRKTPAAAAPKSSTAKDAEANEEAPLVPREPKAKSPLKNSQSATSISNIVAAVALLPKIGGFLIFLHYFHSKFPSLFYTASGLRVNTSSARWVCLGSRTTASSPAASSAVDPVIDVAPDLESYHFESINLESEADKAYFEVWLAWDLGMDGKNWADGKNFVSYDDYLGIRLVTITDYTCLKFSQVNIFHIVNLLVALSK
ncbi:hypothetical protein FRC01_001458 [Tulasnella sp. 417]|nr:hypothetical protein FRC01_001458 [Tulasnella sp. 417]